MGSINESSAGAISKPSIYLHYWWKDLPWRGNDIINIYRTCTTDVECNAFQKTPKRHWDVAAQALIRRAQLAKSKNQLYQIICILLRAVKASLKFLLQNQEKDTAAVRLMTCLQYRLSRRIFKIIPALWIQHSMFTSDILPNYLDIWAIQGMTG